MAPSEQFMNIYCGQDSKYTPDVLAVCKGYIGKSETVRLAPELGQWPNSGGSRTVSVSDSYGLENLMNPTRRVGPHSNTPDPNSLLCTAFRAGFPFVVFQTAS